MNLKAIKVRRAAITPGKWRELPLSNHDDNLSWGVRGEKSTVFFAQGRCNQQDAAFIANAPADIDALISRVEELEAENTRLTMSESRIRSDARSEAILDTRKYLAEGLRKLDIKADDKISLTEVLQIVSRFIDNVGDLYDRVKELEAMVAPHKPCAKCGREIHFGLDLHKGKFYHPGCEPDSV